MAVSTKIEWTDASWNPVTGCSKISIGCKNCYALRMIKRLKAMGQHRYANGSKVVTHEEILSAPIRWRNPRMIFVNSMSDLFHRDVPFEFIKKIYDTMVNANWHIFQILTKRAKRLADLSERLIWPENVWMGVTVETKDYYSRIDYLKRVRASVRFLSLEPLLGPMPYLPLEGIDWVIVGGESGPQAREIKKEWVIEIKDYCLKNNVPFFFKQWGGFKKKQNGRLLEGRTWDEWPALMERKNDRLTSACG